MKKKTETEPFDVAAYGGEGWSPRTRNLAEEIGDLWGTCGASTEYARLKAVLLYRPGAELSASTDTNATQMLKPVDWQLAQAQHDGIAQAYRNAGVAVHYLEPLEQPSPNQMFCADLMFMTPEGVILARPASTVRAGEERFVVQKLAELGIPIIRSVRGKGTFEGADAIWLDSQTVMLGRGLRTNDAGAAQVSSTLKEMDVEVVLVDLPFGTMHLMGMLRIVDHDLALARPRRLAHRGVEALRARGYHVAFVPDSWETANNKAFNCVTLGSKEILMVDGNPNTQAFFEGLGIKCHAVAAAELGKAAGAIGCLTGVLERER
ncbi:MAG: amidinotransferase [Chloroflexi bacterium]|nr:amidinotransferase [Chloroflexota bacterium]